MRIEEEEYFGKDKPSLLKNRRRRIFFKTPFLPGTEYKENRRRKIF